MSSSDHDRDGDAADEVDDDIELVTSAWQREREATAAWERRVLLVEEETTKGKEEGDGEDLLPSHQPDADLPEPVRFIIVPPGLAYRAFPTQLLG